MLQPNLTGINDTLFIGGRLHSDYAMSNWLCIGIETGFSTAKVGDTHFSVGVVPILARIAWHPFKFKSVKPYLVGKAGYGIGFWTKEGNGNNWTDPCGGFVWGIDLGVRYFITETIGVFIEAGYECQCFNWEHPGIELGKWEDTAKKIY